MKHSLLLLVLLLVAACSTDASKEDSDTSDNPTHSIKGKFVRVGDNERSEAGHFVKLIKEIEFKGNYCHFTYVTTKMSGKYEIDEDFVYITTGSELGILSLEIINDDHLEGEGFVHGTFRREGSFETVIEIGEEKKMIAPEPIEAPVVNTVKPREYQTQSNSNRTSSEPSSGSDNNATNSEREYDNPFGSGGGSGGGYGDSGSGTGPGWGNGSGSGEGSSYGANRKVLIRPDFSAIESDENVTIALNVTIDAEGNVVSCTPVRSKTTTTDQVLINKVVNEVKRKVKYNKAPGSSLVRVPFTVKISPN